MSKRPGKQPKLGYHLALWRVKGEPTHWVVRLPVLGGDRRPVPGARRTRVFLPLHLTQRQADAEARRIYARMLDGADGGTPARAPMLLETLAEHHRRVACGPARPVRPRTAKSYAGTVANVACWLLDPYPRAPSRPVQLIDGGTAADPADAARAALAADFPVEEFRGRRLDDLIDYLARRMSATGVNLQLRNLRLMLRWAERMELIRRCPITRETMLREDRRTEGARTAPPDERKRHLSQGELAALDGALDPEARRWLRIGYLTGARATALHSLRPAGWDGEELTIPAGKTRGYSLPAPPALAAELAGWTGWRWGLAWYRQRLRVAADALGIEMAWPLHSLRHALATALRDAGLPLEDAALWLDQSVPGAGVTRRYDHSVRTALLRVGAAIPVPWKAATPGEGAEGRAPSRTVRRLESSQAER